MTGSPYLDAFTAKETPDFGRLPVSLPRPGSGQTWTIAWQVRDGDFIRQGQELLRITSDGDRTQDSLSSPVPGRIRIRVPDAAFVPFSMVVAELEFGTGLTFPSAPPHQAQAVRLQQERRQRDAAVQRVQQLQQQVTALRRELPSSGSGPQRQAAKAEDCDPVLIAETLLRHLRKVILVLQSRPDADRSALLPETMRSELLEYAKILQHIPALQAAVRDGGRERRDIVEALYQAKMKLAERSPPELPQEIREDKRRRWDELRYLHLGLL